MQICNIHEAKTHFSKLIDQSIKGEEVIIAKSGEPVARLVPYKNKNTPRKLGGDWEGKVWISDDFDELPEEFIKHFE